MVAFIPSTLQLDILNGFQLLNIAVSESLVLSYCEATEGGVLPVFNSFSLFCKNHIVIYIQSSENDLPCT